MLGFSDSLPLSTRIRTVYNAGEMWTGALSGRENWTSILVIQGVVQYIGISLIIGRSYPCA